MNQRFVSAVRAPADVDGEGWWFAVRDFHPLVVAAEEADQVPLVRTIDDLKVPAGEPHFLGLLEGKPCYAVEVSLDVEPPPGMAFANLRELFGRLPDDLYALAGRAVQIVDWDRTHQFCSRCGTPMVHAERDRAKVCPACSLRSYPRISPAIIVLVHDGDRVLLGRSARFPNAFYSVLAGFVEPGESLEETVSREIYEETGILVKDIRYFGSQPWPFPNSLMIGFTATYAGGEIRLEDDEILDAGWFTVDSLPRIPGRLSIARSLIDWFIEQQGGTVEP